MKQVISNGRLIFRRILIVLSAGAVSLLFQACYGPPPRANADNLSGTVTAQVNGAEVPIQGIEVSTPYGTGKAITDSDGYYEIRVTQYGDHIIRFEDIDGPLNGEFETKEIEWWTDFRSQENVTLALKE